MNLLAPDNYAKALNTFECICAEWCLKSAEITALAVSAVPEHTSLITMSRVFSIYRSLHTIFGDYEQANSWIRKNNTDLGLAAAELISTPSGLKKVQHYLSCQESQVFIPIDQELMNSIEFLVNGVEIDLDERLELEVEAEGIVMKFVEIKGAIRHSDIQSEFEKIGLNDEWINFILGKTMCVFDEDMDFNELINQGIYPVDLERFCYTNKLDCEIIDDDGV